MVSFKDITLSCVVAMQKTVTKGVEKTNLILS